MRKFYSFVLMACALLLCTNAQAATLTGNTGAELQQAITAIMSSTANSGTIVLTQNVELEMDHPIWVGTKDMDGAYKSVTIDLNGHNIKLQSTEDKAPTLFALTHGELILTNSSTTESQIQLLGDSKNGSRIVGVFGTYRSSRWDPSDDKSLYTDSVGDHNVNTRDRGWFSHLVIDKKVKLYAGPGCLAEGVAVACQGKATYYTNAESDSDTETLTYSTNFFPGNSWGLAQGVRVDVYGKVDIQGDDDGKVYGVTIKGTVRSSLNANLTKEGAVSSDAGDYGTYYYQYNDSIHKVSDHVTTHKLDTLDAPFIWIHPEAEVSVRNDGEKVAALYAAGYAKWLVQGTIAGKTGMYVSSGTLDLLDALVKSTANGWEASTDAGSANGGGSGVVINSRTSYSGEVDFVVGGDTKIESVKGFAIEEVVNNTTVTTPNPEHETDPSAPEYIADTKVSTITINGGTLVGGDKGAVIISTETLTATTLENPNDSTKVAVFGVTVDGNQQVTAGGTQGTIESLATDGTHTTEVTVVDPVTGNEKTIAVVSKGGEPATDTTSETTSWDFIAAHSDAVNLPSYKWTKIEADAIESGVVYLGELQINSGSANNLQILTIKEGAALQVKQLIMNNYARIIVEPGAKLIVTGDQGITAPNIENILLQNNSVNNTFATFLFNPKVSSNRHPNATVEFTTNSWLVDDANLQWEWFGIPTYNKAKGITSTGQAFVAVYENSAWTELGLIGGSNNNNPAVLAKLDKPFTAYDLLANCAVNDHPTITISGELVGNINGALNADKKWNPFANSYTAEVDAAVLVNALHSSESIRDAIYIANQQINGTLQWNVKPYGEVGDLKLKPMQAFLLLNNQYVEKATIDYESMVYNPATAAGAPRRVVADDMTAKVCVKVTNEKGVWDDVDLRENAYGQSYEKYMNKDINIYVVAGEKNDYFAAEDLDGTYVGFSTVKGGDFTISFTSVEGREFDLIDLETSARVAVAEGETYSFSAAANTVADYRFKLVERQKAPTAIENTEAVKNVQGIYTITGQFVGEMNVWNTLPAGVYVVNGEKLVK